MQTPVLTVTLNPALDLSARVSHMLAGPKLRMDGIVLEPGGGGVNVARAMHSLGGGVTAWLALGGANGTTLLDLLRAQGVVSHPFEIAGQTRQNWAVTDATGAQYRLQMAGPDWDEPTCAGALVDIVAQASGLVVLSGSQPPGTHDTLPQDMARLLGPGRLVLDTSGAPLSRALHDPDPSAHFLMIRLDQAEAEAQSGQPLPNPQAALDYAHRLVAQNVAQTICIACGADGNVLANTDGAALHCRPPLVPVFSKVGAGDSFVAGFTLAHARGAGPDAALRLGTAAAAAAVMTDGTALCHPDDVARLQPECVLTGLA
jgi:6-phosphofructokinase 2